MAVGSCLPIEAIPGQWLNDLEVWDGLLLETEVFLTSDQRQAALAKVRGLPVILPPTTD